MPSGRRTSTTRWGIQMPNANLKCFAAAAIAGSAGSSSGPAIEFELIDGGHAPVNIVTPGNDMPAQDRHTKQVTLTVLNTPGTVVPDAACALSNDKDSWHDQPGDTLAIRRSRADLHITCVKDSQTVASARVAAAQVEIIVATGTFGRDIDATVIRYPGTLVLAPAGASVASTTRC
jgi:hypothetical protein